MSTQKPIPRTVRVLQPIGADGVGTIEITAGRTADVTTYTVRTASSDWGRAWTLTKDDGMRYNVNLGESPSCDCPGWDWAQAKGGLGCKHLDCLAALRRSGKL